MAEANDLVHFDESLSLSIHDAFLMVSWFGPPTVPASDFIFDKVKALYSEVGICSVIIFLENGTSPPSPEVRSLIIKQHNEIPEQIDCFTILIPDTSFRASIMAIMVKAMERARRNPWKQTIRQTQAALVKWLVANECHHPDPQWLHSRIDEHRKIAVQHRNL